MGPPNWPEWSLSKPARAEQWDELQNARTIQLLAKRKAELANKLGSAAPNLSLKIEADIEFANKLSAFNEAWQWKSGAEWFHEMVKPGLLQSLMASIRSANDHIRLLLEQLAEAKAWRHCFERMSHDESFHLKSWAASIRKIGKGTGKYVQRYRANARASMDKCRGAIPAWIMPLHRVAESIKPRQGLFDVVIVDEASQSGIEALFLYYIADKVIVVGDDKQISPEVWINLNDVHHLREGAGKDIPILDQLGPENSFFDISQILFSGRICLKEHFRCMPEIIQFSNNLCYQNEPLIPLKQYGSNRLEPLRVVHVPTGFISGDGAKMYNDPEADAIALQIQACILDPKYKGRTMGVITLLGESQALLIQKKILSLIGPEVVQERKIVCGDAYAFQGDERDIIFLSMVTAPREGRAMGTLASKKDERRFNVAASRAEEQMWLFHTATVNDLSPACLRHKLLSYFYEPSIKQTSIEGLDVNELRRISAKADRSIQKPPYPFDSWFEIDVFFRIHDKGYRVIPQYHLAGKRIDLLVEGLKGRLAVECDGDHVHRPEHYEKDLARQIDLERCGLTFERIVYSVFQRDPEIAMSDLWASLEAKGIYPGGSGPSTVEQSTENRVEKLEPIVKPLDEVAALAPVKFEFKKLNSSESVLEAISRKYSSADHLVKEETTEFEFTMQNLTNLKAWNGVTKKMTNYFERFLLSQLEKYVYELSRGREPGAKVEIDANKAVDRCRDLGFNPQLSYVSKQTV